MFRILVDLIKLSGTPPSIIYPYPIFAMLVFSFSGVFDIIYLFRAISISFLFCAGINLWNHVNDIDEDILTGKRNVLVENPKVRSITPVIALLLYLSSFLLTILWTVDKRGIAAFIVVAIVTWIYSDKMTIGKKIRRWKEHYITEVTTYLISIPAFTLLLWTLFAPLSLRCFALAIIMTFFMLSGTFLKDIKDITGDKLAGLKTLGVVFPPESLLKISFILLGFYYLFVSIFSLSGLFPVFCIASNISSLGLVYTISHFLNNNWNITLESVKPVKVMVFSNLTSLIILILLNVFIQTPELSQFHLS